MKNTILQSFNKGDAKRERRKKRDARRKKNLQMIKTQPKKRM